MTYTRGLSQFKFCEDDEALGDLDEEEYYQVGIEILRAHMDLFYRECRAYGQLIETNLNGKFAARCFGYTSIPAEAEKASEREFGDLDWNRPCEEYDEPPTNPRPVQAILKESVPDKGPLSDTIVKRILSDLKKIRKQGIYPHGRRGSQSQSRPPSRLQPRHH